MASVGKIEAFPAEPRNLIVAGNYRDGRPHLSPKDARHPSAQAGRQGATSPLGIADERGTPIVIR
jgi:hypothetical protein